MALAETLFNNLQGGLNDFLQNLEKQYIVKFQNQEDTIKRLQQRVDELEQYSEDQKDDTQLRRVKSEDIDELLDEIHQNDDTQEDKQDDDGIHIYISDLFYVHLLLVIVIYAFFSSQKTKRKRHIRFGIR